MAHLSPQEQFMTHRSSAPRNVMPASPGSPILSREVSMELVQAPEACENSWGYRLLEWEKMGLFLSHLGMLWSNCLERLCSRERRSFTQDVSDLSSPDPTLAQKIHIL